MNDKKNKLYKTIMLILLTSFTTFMITMLVMYPRIKSNVLATREENSPVQEILSKTSDSKIDKYIKQVRAVIEKKYLWKDEINEENLEQGAVKGYVEALGDEYTEYIPASEMKEYTENITGSFTGIGISMVKDTQKERVVVYYTIPGSPAEKAGIESGDAIISVDGKEYTSDDFDSISKYIKGEEGSIVKLEVERDGERLIFDIKREKIVENPIMEKILDNNIGYIYIPSFDEGTAKSFEDKVKKMEEQGITKLIIDVRNNGGGIVGEATEIADLLLEKGKTIISTEDKDNKKETTYSKNNPIFKMPVILLVNEKSASASEILACSLQDNDRAKIVGNTTYGKGVIQTFLSLSDGSGLKITSEQYYTPKGNKIHKVGVKPDEIVENENNVKTFSSIGDEADVQLKKAIEIITQNN